MEFNKSFQWLRSFDCLLAEESQQRSRQPHFSLQRQTMTTPFENVALRHIVRRHLHLWLYQVPKELWGSNGHDWHVELVRHKLTVDLT